MFPQFWDNTLEELAQASVDTCQYNLDLNGDSEDSLIQLTGNTAVPSKNAVSAFHISCQLLSFTVEDS